MSCGASGWFEFYCSCEVLIAQKTGMQGIHSWRVELLVELEIIRSCEGYVARGPAVQCTLLVLLLRLETVNLILLRETLCC